MINSDGFEVDLAAIREASSSLRRLVTDMSPSTLDHLDASGGAYGHNELSAELGGFKNDAKRALTTMLHDVDRDQQALDQTAGLYEQRDSGTAADFGRVGDLP